MANMTGSATPPQDAGASLPHWLKTVAGWWYQGKIDDATFQNLIRYLASEKIVS